MWISLGQSVLSLQFHNKSEKCLKGIFADGLIPVKLAGRQIKHDQEVLRPAQCEIHISASTQSQTFSRRLARGRPPFHRVRQPLKSFDGDSFKQLSLVPKMAIRRVV